MRQNHQEDRPKWLAKTDYTGNAKSVTKVIKLTKDEWFGCETVDEKPNQKSMYSGDYERIFNYSDSDSELFIWHANRTVQ